MFIILLRVLSFDVGETLIDHYYFDFVWDNVIPRLYANNKGLSFQEAKDYVLKEYDRIDSNDIRWYLPEYWFERFNLHKDPLEIFRLHADKIRFYPEVSSVLENLSHKYDLVIASSIQKNLIEIIIKKYRHFFAHVFSSISDLGETKKTSIFYEMICKSLGIYSSEIIHVGNNKIFDFEVPRKIGMKSFLLDRKGENSGTCILRNLKELEGYLELMTENDRTPIQNNTKD